MRNPIEAMIEQMIISYLNEKEDTALLGLHDVLEENYEYLQKRFRLYFRWNRYNNFLINEYRVDGDLLVGYIKNLKNHKALNTVSRVEVSIS